MPAPRSSSPPSAADARSRKPESFSPPVVVARGLAKRFGERWAVRGIDLEIERGGCFGLLGPNGAGKTTTLRMMLGLSPPSAGSLEVLGLPLPAHRRRVRARIGVVPQTDNLDPDFTVLENLRVYASYFGIPRREADRRARAVLALVELERRQDAPIGTLSGGMRRRLTIARALVNEPELLVLDEPTTGLDPQVRHLVWSRLRALGRQGRTLLLTTHYMEEAERLCDDLAIIDGGRLIARGSPRALIDAHVEGEVFELGAEQEALLAPLRAAPGVRIERADNVLYVYTRDTGPVFALLEAHPEVRYLHRPASLEDVFLRLTGRDLRD